MQHDSHLRWFRCVSGGRGTAGGRCWTRRRLGPGQHHLEETIAHSSKQRMRSVLQQRTSHILFRKNVSGTIIIILRRRTFDFPRFPGRKARQHCDENDDRDDRRTDILCRVPAKRTDAGNADPYRDGAARPTVASRIVAMTIREPFRDASEKREFDGAGKQLNGGGVVMQFFRSLI